MNIELPLPLLLGADEPSGSGGAGTRPVGSAVEVLARVLQESADVLEQGEGIEIPEDELHREILLPLLPSMLRDRAIQQHWREQAATGFRARLQAHLDGPTAAPQWVPGDFEIHVTASYLAGPDAKALADTLLSEESLRTLTADLLNQVLAVVWPKLPLASAEESGAVETADSTINAILAPVKANAPAEKGVSVEAKASVDVATPAALPMTESRLIVVPPVPIARVRVKSSFEIARQLARLPQPRPRPRLVLPPAMARTPLAGLRLNPLRNDCRRSSRRLVPVAKKS